jgi:hypothetical protein
VALDKSEGAVKDKSIPAVLSHTFFTREVEDQDSGNLTLNQSPVEIVLTGPFHQPIDLAANSDDDSSMRTSRLFFFFAGCESAQSTPAI